MITFLTVIHITTVILLVIAVLLQSGKGAEISATFGGSSQTVFGSSGGANFFQKLTYGLAAVFMITSVALTILPGKLNKSVFEGYTPPAAAPGTAAPGTAAPGATTGTAAPSKAAPAAATKAEPVKSAPAAAPAKTAPATTAPQKK